LAPAICLAQNRGIKPHDLRVIEKHVFANHSLLLQAYHERHSR
jgi:hypothetical protein